MTEALARELATERAALRREQDAIWRAFRENRQAQSGSYGPRLTRALESCGVVDPDSREPAAEPTPEPAAPAGWYLTEDQSRVLWYDGDDALLSRRGDPTTIYQRVNQAAVRRMTPLTLPDRTGDFFPQPPVTFVDQRTDITWDQPDYPAGTRVRIDATYPHSLVERMNNNPLGNRYGTLAYESSPERPHRRYYVRTPMGARWCSRVTPVPDVPVEHMAADDPRVEEWRAVYGHNEVQEGGYVKIIAVDDLSDMERMREETRDRYARVDDWSSPGVFRLRCAVHDALVRATVAQPITEEEYIDGTCR